MGRPPCCDKSNVKRGLWTPEEDAKILAYVSNHGVGNWTLVPKKAGLNRCGKSCRLRWTNYLRPDLKHDDFTPQEEELIISLHHAIGSRWSLIAKRLPGRTDNDVKNYWNTKLRKKLHKMGIDPVTHKPFSQIISDYGNISGLPNNTMNQVGRFNRHMNSSSLVFPKMETSQAMNQTGLSNTSMVLSSMMIDQVQENNSWELLANQFQLADFNNTVQPQYFLNEANSSCSSSPSSSIVNLSSPMSVSSHLPQPQPQPQPHRVVSACSSSSWTDFLVTDPSPSLYVPKQEELCASSSTMPQTMFNGTDGDYRAFSAQARDYSEAASSVSSFVESILDRDSQMRSEFPELLDEYEY